MLYISPAMCAIILPVNGRALVNKSPVSSGFPALKSNGARPPGRLEQIGLFAFPFDRSLVGVTGEGEGKPLSLGSLETAEKVAKEAPLDERLPGIAAPNGTVIEGNLVLGIG